MDEVESNHSQQINTGKQTNKQTLHVLTQKWKLNDENTQTQGGEHHTLGSVGGWGEGKGEHWNKYLLHVGLKT